MNETLYRSVMVCKYHIKDRILNKRLWLTSIAFILFLYLAEEGLRFFSAETGEMITPWVFPFLTSDWICQILISGYFLWILSSLCSQKKSDTFVITRAGKWAWICGKWLSVIISALFYVMCIAIISVMILIPYVELSMEWGKTWKTLALRNLGEYDIQIMISPSIIRNNTTLEAFGKSCILQFLCLCWLALLMLLVCNITKKIVGVYVGYIFLFFDVMLTNTMMEKLYIFSPVTMVQLGNYSLATKRYGLDFNYSIRFYLLGIFVFSVLIFRTWRLGEGAQY